MNIKSRLHKLEQQRGGGMPKFICLYFDEGVVTKDGNGEYPELIGKTEQEIDALFEGRDDVKVLGIFYASQVHGNGTGN